MHVFKKLNNMNRQQLKKLADLTIALENVDEGVVKYVSEKLSRSDLKEYLLLLKKLVNNNTVYVKTDIDISRDVKKTISEMFPGKKMVFEKDTFSGGGVSIKTGDNIFNLSVKNYINQTVETLKEQL